MSDPFRLPNVQAALARSGLRPSAPDVATSLASAFEHPEIEPAGILEITRANWANDEQGADDVLLVQTRAGLFVMVRVRRRMLRPGGTLRIRLLYEWYQDLIENDELAGSSIFFLAKPGHVDFLLSFSTSTERDRMFGCIFEAHRGMFERWDG